MEFHFNQFYKFRVYIFDEMLRLNRSATAFSYHPTTLRLHCPREHKNIILLQSHPKLQLTIASIKHILSSLNGIDWSKIDLMNEQGWKVRSTETSLISLIQAIRKSRCHIQAKLEAKILIVQTLTSKNKSLLSIKLQQISLRIAQRRKIGIKYKFSSKKISLSCPFIGQSTRSKVVEQLELLLSLLLKLCFRSQHWYRSRVDCSYGELSCFNRSSKQSAKSDSHLHIFSIIFAAAYVRLNSNSLEFSASQATLIYILDSYGQTHIQPIQLPDKIVSSKFLKPNTQQQNKDGNQGSGWAESMMLLIRVYCGQQQFQMIDKQKIKELQQRSHTRGLLYKEFFHNQQQQLERQRREMKRQLDRQVEQRRRQKQHEKMQNQRRIKREQQEIKSYYRNIEGRDKRPTVNDSFSQNNLKNSVAPYQTYPNESQYQSGVKAGKKDRGRGSKPFIPIEADIPLMPLIPEYSPPNNGSQQIQGLANSKFNSNLINPGAIPLLDLSEEQNVVMGAKTKKGKQKTKRQRTLQTQKEPLTQKIQQSRPQIQVTPPISNQRWGSNNERKSTFADQETIVGSIVRAANSLQKRNNESEYIHEEIDQVEQQNRTLKMELKKSQQAVSLLMGAMRSNGKLDKYRAQAEKILTGNLQGSMVSKKEEAKQESGLMLPKINLRNQSIMHDYIISAALRAKKGTSK